MSEGSSTIQQKELSAGWKAIRFFLGVLIFLIVGPPIGSVIYIAGALREPLWTHPAPFVDIFRVPFMLFIIAFASYILGWLPALIAGIVVSAGQVYSSGMSKTSAAIAAVLTSPIAPALSYISLSRVAHPPSIGYHVALAIASITATMSCWWILRKVGISGYKRS